ncbi:hypothetical protein WJX73_008673 [Symbiochloris irregularis]|uniref:Uncharacterized protein n=1 Tax=Symbiochloris irregularis TaxID=706552 RepID=A0AAW1PF67_9CHLO
METAESLASTLYWRQRLKFAHSDQQHLLGAQPLQTEAGQILHWGALRTYGFTPEPATAVTAKAAGRASSKAPDKAVGSDNRQRNAKATKPAKRKSVSARAVATTVSISPEGEQRDKEADLKPDDESDTEVPLCPILATDNISLQHDSRQVHNRHHCMWH